MVYLGIALIALFAGVVKGVSGFGSSLVTLTLQSVAPQPGWAEGQHLHRAHDEFGHGGRA